LPSLRAIKRRITWRKKLRFCARFSKIKLTVRFSAFSYVFLKFCFTDSDVADGAIPIDKESEVFEKVLEILNYFAENPIEEISEDDYETKDAYNAEKFKPFDDAPDFCQGKVEMTVFCVDACNYLDFNEGLTWASRKVAHMIKGKSTEEMRKIFGITNDFTPEEEEEMRKENEWCEDK
jgi:S-phase kinase-associated protein 1